ncbi:hypothetical protein PV327_010837 [Microctonus hyperodae]|uniref:Uncharacterized protein n=1 Tax=Microctonus hyperodae TaxID=165561 RepID=A0AA39C8E6_MICHY|nr:hypothetical protein PV327_010837 [Microctonus hyperodae]
MKTKFEVIIWYKMNLIAKLMSVDSYNWTKIEKTLNQGYHQQRESKMFLYKLCTLLILVLIILMSCFNDTNAGARKRFRRSPLINLHCPNHYGFYENEKLSAILKLDKVCDDCYYLFREPFIHTSCRNNCFTSKYFKYCAENLLLDDDEMKQLKDNVKTLQPSLLEFWT